MIRKKKKYSRPRQIFEKERIEEENVYVKKYGLKNKKEVWKTLAKVTYYRHRAKDLAKKPVEEQEVFFNKLRALGLKVESISDVLGLKIENLFERRLPTVVVKKGLADTVKQARQMVVHKLVRIDGKAINSPSYLVPVAEESMITVKKKVKKAAEKVKEEAAESTEEQAEEISEENESE